MDRKFLNLTDSLFVMPNFFTGTATVLNLAGNFYGYKDSDTGEEADESAIKGDFDVIGQDIADAIEGISDDFEKLL